MRSARRFSVFTILIFSLSCSRAHPDEARAKQLFREIDEIGRRPAGGRPKEEIMQILSSLNERKKKFPEGRDEIVSDTKVAKEYFQSIIQENQQLIGKYEELQTLRLYNSNLTCAAATAESLRNQIESAERVIEEFDLVFDSNIANKEGFDERTAEIRVKAKAVEVKQTEADAKQKDLCSKAKLGIEE